MGRALRLLLDTHAYYWLIYADDRLPARAAEAIASCDQACVSLASYWELAIKARSGKIQVDRLLAEGPAGLANDGLTLLNVAYRHIRGTLHLPLHHRDPFDRLLISQAKIEDLTLVSNDAVLDQYDVKRLW